ncbi:YegP family protein [Pectobacterium polaris]|uniref:YegP family protein n=1 Tax=Pectobacterium polaris TaxID=2042057 RepID=UPI001CF4C17F|nr:YegP family protein [Pectobacterium polaris]MCA6941339.1 YegP family protein [Pectobacterium polaris]MCA6956393.1 YegP family protein [Pectobacterium polaris]
MGYYELKKSPTATQQQYYWVLKASNHEVIATSEMYSSKQAAQNGIRSVQVNGPTTDIRDESGGLSSILGLR